MAASADKPLASQIEDSQAKQRREKLRQCLQQLADTGVFLCGERGAANITIAQDSLYENEYHIEPKRDSAEMEPCLRVIFDYHPPRAARLMRGYRGIDYVILSDGQTLIIYPEKSRDSSLRSLLDSRGESFHLTEFWRETRFQIHGQELIFQNKDSE